MASLDPAFSTQGPAWSLDRFRAMPAEPDDAGILIRAATRPWSSGDLPERTRLAPANAELRVAPGEPLDATRPTVRRRKWKAAMAASCLLHLATAAFLLAENHEAVMIAGAEESGVMLLGNAPEDQSAAGTPSELPAAQVTLVTMLEPKPVQTVAAAAVPVAEAAEPVETEVAEATTAETPLAPTAEVVAAEPEQSTPVVEQATTEPAATPSAAVANPAPEILTTLQPDEDKTAAPEPARQVAEQPKSPGTAGPDENVETKEAATSERVVAEADRPIPVEKKTVAKAEQSRKKPAKKPDRKAETAGAKATSQRPKAGSGGNSEADARRGAAQGEAAGTTVSASKGGAASAAGNAAVSNYPGKVAARLRRAVRGISSLARAKARNDVRVSFVVDANGGVGGISIIRGSGSPELDEAALAVVRRAAPFPPIPPQAGRSSWAFTLPLGIAR
ncbi:protein TonB [Mycoplana sp. BE70]|uniref:energy transducer TonB family protein n=1 Tax=Mycoplana sp. BE70 TaxID=2817775 RepID=UPI0028633B79|nr:TonB family protein [Mycoplana sp. BE70]MDR6759103.1 protein TonB [Mycoplana sp. BE70]